MKFRILNIACSLLLSFSIKGQRQIAATDSLSIIGKISKPITYTIADLDTFPKINIGNQIIYNHKGEAKDTLTGMKGISLKTLLATVEYTHAKPRYLNEFYLVFVASDGYKVVFSWNEIYNTDNGNNVFIVTELRGKPLKNLDQRILFISTGDTKSGRRYIKGLRKIEVKQVE